MSRSNIFWYKNCLACHSLRINRHARNNWTLKNIRGAENIFFNIFIARCTSVKEWDDEGWGMRGTLRRLFAPLTFRRESVLRARMERTVFRTKDPFRTLARARECFFHRAITSRLYEWPRFRPSLPTRSRARSKLVRKDTRQIFPFHLSLPTPVSFSRGSPTSARSFLALANQRASRLGIFHPQLHPLRLCV